jgi:DNA-binding XRE family transcriptional regulator
MSNKEIKILLMRKDVKQADIARQLKVSKTAVHNVIKGISESKRIKKAIAESMGISINDLWPGEITKTHSNVDDVLSASSQAGLKMEHS